MKKTKLKVGDLVKYKWAFSAKIDKWKRDSFNISSELYIPPMGIIKKIKKKQVEKIKLDKDSVAHKTIVTVEVAEILWSDASIPEIKGESNKWEVDYQNKYHNEIELKNLILYSVYYKGMMNRRLKKTLNKENPD